MTMPREQSDTQQDQEQYRESDENERTDRTDTTDQETETTASTVDADATDADASEAGARDADATEADVDQRERLVPEDHAQSYGARWDAVKGTFVDEPREAVAQADALVGEVLDELEKLFREQRRSIEQGLDSDETSTEDLRMALRRYRSFFDRLLSV
jgi:hypothetical protein